MVTFLKVLGCAIVILLSFPQKALAWVECSGHVTQIYITDGGALYVWFDNGAWTSMQPSDPNLNGSLALMTTALTTGKTALYRVNSTGCTNSQPTALPLTGTSLLNH